MMIKANDIWVGPNGSTIKWLMDVVEGEVVTIKCLELDGRKPERWEVFPAWVGARGLSVPSFPPWPNVVLRDGKVLHRDDALARE